MVFFYQLYGLKVQSNIRFPQLLEYKTEQIEESFADVDISVTEGDELQKRFSEILERGGNWGFTENGLWFSNNSGVFLLETINDVSTMTCERFEGVPDSVIRSFMLGNCIAVIMTQRKKLVLHGSSIVMGDTTALICGDSGTGKSTLSMALLDNGGRLMADDISVLDVIDDLVFSFPGFPEQKLCRDAALDNGFDLNELTYIDEDRDKFSVDRSEIFINERHKVDVLFSLHLVSDKHVGDEFENGVMIKEVLGAEKVNVITDRFFLEWLYGNDFVLEPSEMMKVFAMAGQIRIYDITRVRGVDTKEYLVKRVSELLR